VGRGKEGDRGKAAGLKELGAGTLTVSRTTRVGPGTSRVLYTGTSLVCAMVRGAGGGVVGVGRALVLAEGAGETVVAGKGLLIPFIRARASCCCCKANCAFKSPAFWGVPPGLAVGEAVGVASKAGCLALGLLPPIIRINSQRINPIGMATKIILDQGFSHNSRPLLTFSGRTKSVASRSSGCSVSIHSSSSSECLFHPAADCKVAIDSFVSNSLSAIEIKTIY
jgi:hypothetical protein